MEIKKQPARWKGHDKKAMRKVRKIVLPVALMKDKK